MPRRRCERPFCRVVMVPPKSLPFTSSGKLSLARHAEIHWQAAEGLA